MKTLRIATIGVGAYENSRARTYLKTIQKLNGLYTLCALCDHDQQALEAVGSKLNVGALYNDVEEMLVEEKPEVVFVLIPTDGQSVMALTAAGHKCNIITEIPYAITLPIGDAISGACMENGVKWEIAENVWLWPHERLKREIVRSGSIGEIIHSRLWYTSGPYHGFNAIRNLMGCDVKRVLGYAQLVEALPYTSYGGTSEEASWWENGNIEFEDGTVCLYEKPPIAGARGSRWEIEGTRGYLAGNGVNDELVLKGDNGQVSYPFKDIYEQRTNGEKVLASVRVDTEPPLVWDNPFKDENVSDFDDVAKAGILHSLHRAVTEEVELGYGARNARRDMEIWLAIRESARKGSSWVDLPLKDVTELEELALTQYVRRYGHDPITETSSLLNTPFDRLSVMWTLAGFL